MIRAPALRLKPRLSIARMMAVVAILGLVAGVLARRERLREEQRLGLAAARARVQLRRLADDHATEARYHAQMASGGDSNAQDRVEAISELFGMKQSNHYYPAGMTSWSCHSPQRASWSYRLQEAWRNIELIRDGYEGTELETREAEYHAREAEHYERELAAGRTRVDPRPAAVEAERAALDLARKQLVRTLQYREYLKHQRYPEYYRNRGEGYNDY